MSDSAAALSNTTADLGFLEPFIGSEIVSIVGTIDPWEFSIAILILSIIFATIVLAALKIITTRIASRTKTELDDRLLEAVQKPAFRLIIMGGLYLAALNMGLDSALGGIIAKFILTAIYLTVILFFGKALGIFVKYGLEGLAQRTESIVDDEIIPIFHKTVRAVIWVFGLILILGAWGVDVGPFLAGLGIAGLAISFALQSTLANVFSGISLILDKTFKVGDKIQLDSGEIGLIHDITLRSTRLRTFDNEIITIPNEMLAKSKIRNYTQPDQSVRVVVNFSVEYGNDPEKVKSLIEKTITDGIEGISPDPPVSVVFVEMGSSSLNFVARFWIPDYNQAFEKKVEATNLIYNTLGKEKIGIPFPTQTIHLKK